LESHAQAYGKTAALSSYLLDITLEETNRNRTEIEPRTNQERTENEPNTNRPAAVERFYLGAQIAATARNPRTPSAITAACGSPTAFWLRTSSSSFFM
jgi:hypothetical protein